MLCAAFNSISVLSQRFLAWEYYSYINAIVVMLSLSAKSVGYVYHLKLFAMHRPGIEPPVPFTRPTLQFKPLHRGFVKAHT